MIVWLGGRDSLKDGKKNTDGRGAKRGGEDSLKRNRVLWIVPVVYGIVAGVEAMLAGSVVGLM